MPSIRSTPLKSGLLAFVLLAASLLLNPLPGQTPATPPATPAAAPAGGGDAGAAPASGDAGAAGGAAPNIEIKATHASDLFFRGGFVMYILTLASICLVWFTAEGFFILRAKRLAPPALIARLKEAFKAGNYQEAWNICKANRCFLSNVLANGLERIGRSKDAVEFIVEETALREANDLKTNPTYLSVIGVVAPMIGLTGTVWGMIGAFNALGQNGISNPSLLAGKIGEVLIATMSGLVVAVPAFVFFYILRARGQTAILYAESQVYRLLDEIPYDQLTGVRIGEDFGTESSARSRQLRSGVSQKVSRNATTNCPSCNAPITVGTSPCPNCQTVLDWGTA
jgi:biopolymer transport protein ExbB